MVYTRKWSTYYKWWVFHIYLSWQESNRQRFCQDWHLEKTQLRLGHAILASKVVQVAPNVPISSPVIPLRRAVSPNCGALRVGCWWLRYKIFALSQDVVTCSGSWFAYGPWTTFRCSYGICHAAFALAEWLLLTSSKTLRKAHKVQRFLQTFQKWKVQAGVRSHKIWSSKGRGGIGFYGAMGVVMHGGILVPQRRPSHMVRALLRRRLCSSGT